MLALMIVFGMIKTRDDVLFNTTVVVKSGVLQGAYRKLNLLPGESKVFAPGNSYPLFDLEGIKFGINICYDLNFPNCANLVANRARNFWYAPAIICLRFKQLRNGKENTIQYGSAEQSLDRSVVSGVLPWGHDLAKSTRRK